MSTATRPATEVSTFVQKDDRRFADEKVTRFADAEAGR